MVAVVVVVVVVEIVVVSALVVRNEMKRMMLQDYTGLAKPWASEMILEVVEEVVNLNE